MESLLTHSPKPTDPYDSITRQVKKKLTLLDNRWAPRIDYQPFSGTAPEKIWGKMYEYRSKIAHGAHRQYDFGFLGSHDAALSLVKETAKTLIRYALKEPRLLLDLQEC